MDRRQQEKSAFGSLHMECHVMSGLSESMISRLNSATSLADLADIANSLSAASTRPNGILYSGPMPGASSGQMAASLASDMGWGIVDSTPRGELLGSVEFDEALIRIFNSEGISPAGQTAARTQFLYEPGGNSLWSQASREFAASIS